MTELTRPLTAFDLETTSAEKATARIVQIGIIRLHPSGERDKYESLVNPEIPIPPAATEIHGITDEMVKDKPTWRQLAPRLLPAFQGADYLGFNIARFDLEVLGNEFRRVGVDTSVPAGQQAPRIIDPYVLWVKTETRTLEDAVEHFLDRKHIGAHSALADVEEALAVFAQQMRWQFLATIGEGSEYAERWKDVPTTLQELHDYQFPPVPGAIDAGARFIFVDGVPTVNFGKKWKGTPMAKVDKGFYWWMLSTDMPEEALQIAREAIQGRYPVKGEV